MNCPSTVNVYTHTACSLRDSDICEGDLVFTHLQRGGEKEGGRVQIREVPLID